MSLGNFELTPEDAVQVRALLGEHSYVEAKMKKDLEGSHHVQPLTDGFKCQMSVRESFSLNVSWPEKYYA